MNKYKEYFYYRNDKIEFIKEIEKNKTTTLNEEYLVSYLNRCYIYKKLPSIKHYKTHIVD